MDFKQEISGGAGQADGPSTVDWPASQAIPLFRRDLWPSNLVLSAADLKELAEVLSDANASSRAIEFQKRDVDIFESDEEAWRKIIELMPMEYNYRAKTGDSVQGLGIPSVNDRAFPEDLNTIFFSNASFSERAINVRPGNIVEAFLAFDKPTLRMDLQTLPSNPTENRSVINVEGNDEVWVIATTEKIRQFLVKKRATRPVIHGSGAYDSFIYFLFLPSVLWLFFKLSSITNAQWLGSQTVFFNVLVAIYTLLLLLQVGRFLFQYIRWLFPPMEYYKDSRTLAGFHRAVAGLVFSGIFLSALYDIFRYLAIFILP
ncbi:MAG: hypothetical protein AAGG57_11235 [Pseudomonadota bacterium]